LITKYADLISKNMVNNGIEPANNSEDQKTANIGFDEQA
jgi:hypothetical protein